MKFLDEKARRIPVRGEYDVIVCGGGSAGFVAAIASARRGARTLLVERYGFLGGTATAALMVEFGSMHDGEKELVGGATHEFLHRLESYGGAYFTNQKAHSMIFDPESMIAVCQAMVEESGVEILLHSWLADAIVDKGKVVGVVVESKSGREAALGKVVIDCTGDGDIAARAGASWEEGRPEDAKTQPATIEIILGNVDARRACRCKDLIPKIRKAKEDGRWSIETDQIFSWGRVMKRGAPEKPESSFFFVNGTNAVDIDGTDVESLTRAELLTRRQIPEMISFLRSDAPGFENCYLDRAGAQIGVRETRRIEGDYVLTRADVLSARRFRDGVVPACNSIDVHDVAGKVFEHEFVKAGSHYQIPYRCLLPKGLDGLLLAGRCLSADHWALGSARVMIITMPMGEAAGVAAALAVKSGVEPRALEVSRLQDELRNGGTTLESVG